MDKTVILKLEHITKNFGGLKAVDDVSLEVKKGQIQSLIGPNGAGKTTLFNIITRIYSKDSGSIHFTNHNLDRYKAHQLIKMGIARTFQNIQLFDEMNIWENVAIGSHIKMSNSPLDAILCTHNNKKWEKQAKEKAIDTLRFLKIDRLAYLYPKEISFGNKRLIELARALVSDPVLLLLDEPASGLNESETSKLLKIIFRIWEKGVTILLIEHDMNLVMNCSHSIAVMDGGKKIAQGMPSYIQNNKKVIKAYLGE